MNTTTQTCILIVEFKLLGLPDMCTVLLNLCIWLYPTIPSPYPLRGEERERENASLRISSSGPPTLSFFLSSGVLESCNPHYHIRARSLLSLSLSPTLFYHSISLLVQVQYFIYCTEMGLFLWISFSWSCPGCSLYLHTSRIWRRPNERGHVLILKIYRRWF